MAVTKRQRTRGARSYHVVGSTVHGPSKPLVNVCLYLTLVMLCDAGTVL
jgi:hypothetical protein